MDIADVGSFQDKVVLLQYAQRFSKPGVAAIVAGRGLRHWQWHVLQDALDVRLLVVHDPHNADQDGADARDLVPQADPLGDTEAIRGRLAGASLHVEQRAVLVERVRVIVRLVFGEENGPVKNAGFGLEVKGDRIQIRHVCFCSSAQSLLMFDTQIMRTKNGQRRTQGKA